MLLLHKTLYIWYISFDIEHKIQKIFDKNIIIMIIVSKEVKKLFKLISLDLDGTLLDSKKNISLNSFNFLKKLRKKNIIIVFNSGRSFYDMKNILNFEDCYLICNNGGQIFYNTEEIFCYHFDEKILNRIQDIFLLNKYIIKVYSDKNQYFYIPTKFEEAIELILEKEENRLQEIEIYKKIIYKNSIELKELNLSKFKNEKILKLSIITNEKNIKSFMKIEDSDFDIIKVFKTNIEIVPKNINKFSGIKVLLEKLSIPLTQVIAFGDEENDLLLLRKAGLGIAMSNSSNVLLNEIALQTTFSNDEDGVLRVLKQIFKEK